MQRFSSRLNEVLTLAGLERVLLLLIYSVFGRSLMGFLIRCRLGGWMIGCSGLRQQCLSYGESDTDAGHGGKRCCVVAAFLSTDLNAASEVH